MIKPTVGRVVWFNPSTAGIGIPGFLTLGDQPCNASIAYVWSDRLVNLTVSDHYGNTFNATSVQLLQDDDARPALGYFAEWMPYQVGQAKQHGAAGVGQIVGGVAGGGLGIAGLAGFAGDNPNIAGNR